MKFCSNCGKQLDENCKFCPYCGTKAESVEVALVEENAEEVKTSLKTVLLHDLGQSDKIKIIQYITAVVKKDLLQTVEILKKVPVKILEGVSESDANEIANNLTKMGALCEVVDADAEIITTENEEIKVVQTDKNKSISKTTTSKKNAVMKLLSSALFLVSILLILFLPFASKTFVIEEESVTKSYSIFGYTVNMIESLGSGDFIADLTWFWDFLIIVPITSLISPLIMAVNKTAKNVINCVKTFKGKEIVQESTFSLSILQKLSIKTIIGLLIPTIIVFIILLGFNNLLWVTPIVIFAVALIAEIVSKIKE